MDADDDPSILAGYRYETRQRWGRVTPFRLGMMVGEIAADPGRVACPYRTAYGAQLFNHGVEVGINSRIQKETDTVNKYDDQWLDMHLSGFQYYHDPGVRFLAERMIALRGELSMLKTEQASRRIPPFVPPGWRLDGWVDERGLFYKMPVSMDGMRPVLVHDTTGSGPGQPDCDRCPGKHSKYCCKKPKDIFRENSQAARDKALHNRLKEQSK